MTGGIDVDLGTLTSIAALLDRGADDLEGLAGSVPAGVDAGPMTGFVASLLSQVVDSAGNVSTASTAAADLVRLSGDYYRRADAEAEADFADIKKAMEQ
ncbi:hypothetical protein [Aeromicrobium chenweiae]|uniref:Uncharacterized protein n=1 Tax=Aeromicrobium chenweiae TaxID=2079793 RepID=A0A2S0WMQ3_9ACTN|nr:hypothetical protein [Aeromicrobium chenweiae]AWB92629.1 hypothetical protein C3E78_10695 [Aeromicrobium chenweiae]TGN33617.1 hypothetical protein E4L97_00735 [Aeromicrobium chenweiae]